ncbi:MAG: glycosyltransferase [Acidobacteria bacterium]|nr:glycosyltransferase [Acidobacteriota bacterium]
MRALLGFLRAIPLLLLSPLLTTVPALALLATDAAFALFGRRRPPANRTPNTRTASVVIPNWNGRDLLAKYIPPLIEALAGHPGSELLVVDNGSSDGSVDFLRSTFPEVRVLALPRNLGFGGGSNAGFEAAANDIVVLLNSDMRVDPGFLRPLLDGFTDPTVFAVSCQIFFSDPKKLREETGLTQGWWENGGVRVRHRIDDRVTSLYPCFYGGGGSCAFDRAKFLELGGFDHLLRPFYLEDTDLGFLAWKRGWRVLYEPRSIVYHEHRGTIGRAFSQSYIQSVVQKNFLLFTWKNIHCWTKLTSHFFYTWAGAILTIVFGESLERPSLWALFKAFLQTPAAAAARWRARQLAVVDDREAFARPMGGYYRDRFAKLETKPKPSVLFVSPYAICPPVHGGGVFMYQTCRTLSQLTQLHLIVLLDDPREEWLHRDLTALCASAEFILRLEGQPSLPGSITPHAIQEFSNRDLEWLIHRKIYCDGIDAIQFEYMPMGQYWSRFTRIPQFLFEHDIYFQSVGRQIAGMKGVMKRAAAQFEYLRALRYELALLPRFDRIQVCSTANLDYLTSFKPNLAPKLDAGLRAGIDVHRYTFTADGRKPGTMLFLGSFRHAPNTEALSWLVQKCFPHMLAGRPDVRLTVIGSDPPPKHSLPDYGPAIDLRGFAEDINQPLAENALFVCPILSGSGVRVKLLEAFAAGIPVVSTYIGAEGLSSTDGEICALASSPEAFAAKAVHLLNHPEEAAEMALRARKHVEEHWDMTVITHRLAEVYARELASKRAS